MPAERTLSSREVVAAAIAESHSEHADALSDAAALDDFEEDAIDSPDNKDAGDTDTPQDTDGTDVTSQSEEDQDQDDAGDESDTDGDDSDEQSEERSGPRAGIDRVLSTLDETGDPSLGRAAKALIKTNQDLQAANKDQASRLQSTEEKFEEYRGRFDQMSQQVEELLNEGDSNSVVSDEAGEATVTSEGRELLAEKLGWRETQIDGFTEALNILGIQTGEQKASEELEQERDSFTDAQMMKGIELFGDDFATVDETGEAVLNVEIAPALKARLEDMDTGMGVTPFQLYIVENWDMLLEKAEQKGVEKAQAESDEQRKDRVTAARKGGGIRRSGGATRGGSTGVAYNPDKGETTRDVLRRARSAAREELGV